MVIEVNNLLTCRAKKLRPTVAREDMTSTHRLSLMTSGLRASSHRMTDSVD